MWCVEQGFEVASLGFGAGFEFGLRFLSIWALEYHTFILFS